MTDPHGPQQGRPSPPQAQPVPPSVPPYAAQLYGTPQQLYPGAPPTWAPAPKPAGSAVLAAIALALAVAGALVAFVPWLGALVSWVFLVPAIVLAIIALVRRSRGRGLAVGALVTAIVGIVVAVFFGGVALFGPLIGGWNSGGGGDYDYYGDGGGVSSYPVLGADLGTDGSSRADALAFGTAVTLIDENTGEAVWEITATVPQDVSAAASPDGPVPQNGAFVAVPVELTNVGDAPIDLAADYGYTPYSWLLTGDGGRADPTVLPDAAGVEPLWDISVVEPGETVTYSEVFDVAESVAETGYFVIDLDTGAQVFWGP